MNIATALKALGDTDVASLVVCRTLELFTGMSRENTALLCYVSFRIDCNQAAETLRI